VPMDPFTWESGRTETGTGKVLTTVWIAASMRELMSMGGERATASSRGQMADTTLVNLKTTLKTEKVHSNAAAVTKSTSASGKTQTTLATATCFTPAEIGSQATGRTT